MYLKHVCNFKIYEGEVYESKYVRVEKPTPNTGLHKADDIDVYFKNKSKKKL